MSTPNENVRPPFDWESIVPPDKFMRVTHFAKWLECSTHHILNLIRSGEIQVPQELQKSAPSGAAMRIPRESILKFLEARSSRTRIAERNRKKAQRRKGKR